MGQFDLFLEPSELKIRFQTWVALDNPSHQLAPPPCAGCDFSEVTFLN